MARLALNRVAGALAAVFGASVIAFVFLRLFPGDPARLVVGPLATPEQLAAVRHDMGLDQSLPTQYWNYVSGFFSGDWGYSFGNGQDVTTLMGDRIPASLELGFYAFLGAFFFAVMLALVATYQRRPVVDGTVRTLSFLGLGTPPFWLGLLLLLLFFVHFGWLPGPEGRLGPSTTPPPHHTGFYTIDALVAGQWGTFWDAVKHLILPAFALGFAPFAYLVRLLRANLLDVSREPFLVVVRSKGLSRWAAFVRHALPNAFLPTLTAGGLILAQLIAGSVLVEKVFNWPGVGQLVVDSILRKDFAVVETFILLSAFSYVIVNAIVDFLYGVIDPRVRAWSPPA
jgi:ABC-type dipeptide/oligopeptide/nickel transport system permease component